MNIYKIEICDLFVSWLLYLNLQYLWRCIQKILLHSCCAPCLTSVYEQLSKTYEVVVFWYNPNIWPKTEHDKRYDELLRYCNEIDIEIIQGKYDYGIEHRYFLDQIKGLEKEPEKGARCQKCYEVRLSATAYTALELNNKHQHFDFFASELSVSPHKNAEALNKIGVKIEHGIHSTRQSLAQDIGQILRYLPNDFKKGGGFRRSVELSKKHNLYRQNYCGCEFSTRSQTKV